MSDRTRSRSRSPLSVSSTSEDETNTEKKQKKQTLKRQNDFNCTSLFLSNVPAKWNWEDCRKFLTHHVSADTKSNLPFTSPHKNGFILKFTNSKDCNKCFRDIIGLTAEGKKINVKPYEKDYANPQRKANKPDQHRKVIQIEDSTCQNPVETFGLSLDFLNQLHIPLPLKRHIFVINLPQNITEEKLKEVFSLAGEIVQLKIIKKGFSKCFGKITYDHPVEAVQAISMFNGQKLYDRAILVQVDTKATPQLLPEGLEAIGPGLGSNGEPLRGIRHITLMEPLKQYITQEIERQKNVPSNNGAALVNNANMMGTAMQSLLTPLNVSTMNPVSAAAMYGINLPQASGWQGLVQQNNGNDVASTLATYQAQAQNSVSSMNAPTQMVTNQWSTTTRMSPEKEQSYVSSDLLVFKNLPPSVTGHALKKKMSEIGQVVFTEMTGEGRAIVRFRDTRDAERCIKLFHQTKVDGQLIEVKFF